MRFDALFFIKISGLKVLHCLLKRVLIKHAYRKLREKKNITSKYK